MDLQFMTKYPDQYVMIVNEIDLYEGASVMTDQILHRVIYRINCILQKDHEATLTSALIRRLTKKAAHELLNRKKQIEVLTDDDLLGSHADNVLSFDEQLTDNELLHDVILLTKNSDERLIISAWANGCNDSEIADILTNIRGGSFEGNRSKIRRCKNNLRKNSKIIRAFAAA